MILKTGKEKETLLSAGKRLREVLDAVSKNIKPGVSVKELDNLAYKMISEGGDKPSFLNYKPAGMSMAFPASLCVSINNQMVHGIPGISFHTVEEGDIVSIDCGLIRNNLFVDSACTIIAGEGDKRANELVEATRKALKYALVFVRAGNRTGDVGSAIETVASEYGFSVPPELGGHGVGESVHEDPFIPNVGDPGTGEFFVENQVVAIEPILTEGEDPRIKLGSDDFAYETEDGSRAAHFEHTLIITNGAPIIVTGGMW